MAVAHLGANKSSEGLAIYAVGFLDGAVALFERADQGVGLVDCTFYPAAYCLRHGIELFAKQMSVYIAYELGKPGLLYEPGHGLHDAWKHLVEEVEAFVDAPRVPEELRHHLDVINTAVDDLEELDARGTLLRYPEFVQPAKATRARTRQETLVPFDDVNLADWLAVSREALAAAQALLAEWGQRADDLRMLRKDPPLPFSDLVMRKTP